MNSIAVYNHTFTKSITIPSTAHLSLTKMSSESFSGSSRSSTADMSTIAQPETIMVDPRLVYDYALHPQPTSLF